MPPPCLLSSSNLFNFFFCLKGIYLPLSSSIDLSFVFCLFFNERESKWLQSHPGASGVFILCFFLIVLAALDLSCSMWALHCGAGFSIAVPWA